MKVASQPGGSDPDTGEDKLRAERSAEDCEAACYDCLMSYYNQMDHLLLDRRLIKEYLQAYMLFDKPKVLEEFLKYGRRIDQREENIYVYWNILDSAAKKGCVPAIR